MRQCLIFMAGSLVCLCGGGLFFQDQVHPQEKRPEHLAKGMIDRATQDAIDAGLEYLASKQHANGSFGTGPQHGSIAVTSLAGLAFMAGGNQPGRGKYGKNVTRALTYVLDHEDPNRTGFLTTQNARLFGPMYGHGFGTLFLAEAQGMVHQADLKDRLRGTLNRAVKLITDSQNQEGGWRYLPGSQDADISVTICQIMALRAARNAGVAVPKTVVDKCTKYVKECRHPSGGFTYVRFQGAPGFARTAAGVVALNSAGEYDTPEVKQGLEFLKEKYHPNNRNADPEARVHYFYGHYYAAQAMWLSGGEHWRNWFPAIRDHLVNGSGFRQTVGESAGSWNDRQFCPHYCTAMALIILQIPNNYLPILQR